MIMIYQDENNNTVSERIERSFKLSKKGFADIKSRYFSVSSSKRKKKKGEFLSVLDSEVFTLRLSDIFFGQPCITLAKDLIGKRLVRKLSSGEILKGLIVETESYLGVTDMASHSFMGKRTERNEAMYMKPGTAYVYSIYGMYYCFNISSLEEGSAVLIRAVEPLEGLNLMREFRNKGRKTPGADLKCKELCSGPAKLCQAFKIEKDFFNKVDLCTSDELWIEEGHIDFSDIISCKRIGIESYAKDWADKPFRFYLKDSCYVSRRSKSSERAYTEKLAAEASESS